MFNLGTGEVLVILLVALIVLGPDKLPQTARKIGQAVGELRRMSAGFQSELRDAMQEPVLRKPASGDFERSDGMPLKPEAGSDAQETDDAGETVVEEPGRPEEPPAQKGHTAGPSGEVTAADDGRSGNGHTTT